MNDGNPMPGEPFKHADELANSVMRQVALVREEAKALGDAFTERERARFQEHILKVGVLADKEREQHKAEMKVVEQSAFDANLRMQRAERRLVESRNADLVAELRLATKPRDLALKMVERANEDIQRLSEALRVIAGSSWPQGVAFDDPGCADNWAHVVRWMQAQAQEAVDSCL